MRIMVGGRVIRQWRIVLARALVVALISGGGCARFGAERLAQAPNTYPAILSPPPRLVVDFGTVSLTNLPTRWAYVGPEPARLRYRIVEPRDYRVSSALEQEVVKGRTRSRMIFRATLPGGVTPQTADPHGTVVLLHGYGLDQSMMVPWALTLAEAGWRCVLLDLRGHGRSTGRRIHFGTVEAGDLRQLLDDLDRRGWLRPPVMAMGESYGASLALRWMAQDHRVRTVVAMAPYPELATAAENLRAEYVPWFPRRWLAGALRRLPEVLRVAPGELDPIRAVAGAPVRALFVAGGQDHIAPPADVERFRMASAPGSRLWVVPEAGHEALPHFLPELVGPVLEWLTESANPVVADHE